MNDVVPKTRTCPRSRLPCCEFADIQAAGTYVTHKTGLLVRVPPDGVNTGRSPMIVVSGRESVLVSRLSEDPWIPTIKARCIAANNDLPVEF